MDGHVGTPSRLDLLKALGDNTRYAIYLELARSPRPLATADVAESLGLHANTVRPHLERMRDVGLLTIETEGRGGVGRPQHRYAPAADAPSLGLEPPAMPLMAAMLVGVAAAAGAAPEEAAAVGRLQGRAAGALVKPMLAAGHPQRAGMAVAAASAVDLGGVDSSGAGLGGVDVGGVDVGGVDGSGVDGSGAGPGGLDGGAVDLGGVDGSGAGLGGVDVGGVDVGGVDVGGVDVGGVEARAVAALGAKDRTVGARTVAPSGVDPVPSDALGDDGRTVASFAPDARALDEGTVARAGVDARAVDAVVVHADGAGAAGDGAGTYDARTYDARTYDARTYDALSVDVRLGDAGDHPVDAALDDDHDDDDHDDDHDDDAAGGAAAGACLAALVGDLARLGFDPAVANDTAGASIAFTHCPFAELAAAHPEIVCHLHRGMVEGFVEVVGGLDVTAFGTLVDRRPCRVELARTTVESGTATSTRPGVGNGSSGPEPPRPGSQR